jgi:hypothetical protein
MFVHRADATGGPHGEHELTLRTPNPLAIGVGFGGLLLDIVAPRPKPRAGVPDEFSPCSSGAVSRTPARPGVDHQQKTPVASGSIR